LLIGIPSMLDSGGELLFDYIQQEGFGSNQAVWGRLSCVGPSSMVLVISVWNLGIEVRGSRGRDQV